MALYDVAAKSVAGAQRALKIHLQSWLKLAEVGQSQCFGTGLKAEAVVGARGHGKAYAIHSHAGADTQIDRYLRLANFQNPPGGLWMNGDYSAKSFDEAGEHRMWYTKLARNIIHE